MAYTSRGVATRRENLKWVHVAGKGAPEGVEKIASYGHTNNLYLDVAALWVCI